MEIYVNDVEVWSTSGTVSEVSMRGKKGEAGRILIEDETSIKLYVTESDEDSVTRAAAPVADAGIDQSKGNAATCTLDGSASTGTGLTYAWTKISGTGGTLNDATVAQPHYTTHATTDDTTIWQLTVTDAEGRSSTDTVSIAVA